MNSKYYRYFKLARNASEFSDYTQYKLGCVIVYKNKIISVAWNTNKENPIQKKYNKERGFDVDTSRNTLHAEINALIKIKDMDIEMDKVKIFIHRETKDGIRALAKPCPACEKAIKDFGIKNVYYTGKDSYIEERYD